MCGITGIYKSNPSNDDLVAMTEAIKHRGPDAFGYYINDNVALGHRRLSILDLSVNGNQPMFSHCKRYVMVYNGEIYNYQEIASELQSQYQSQISFKSSSDSEVILEAYVKWGMGFIEKLNGMFAIAIYDTVMKELILVRDRMGIKPLFYYKDEKQLIFASELKAIREAKGLQFEINQDAIPFF
jgi:asparagine synthase (glutamine-hydrolysing)